MLPEPGKTTKEELEGTPLTWRKSADLVREMFETPEHFYPMELYPQQTNGMAVGVAAVSIDFIDEEDLNPDMDMGGAAGIEDLGGVTVETKSYFLTEPIKVSAT